MKNRVFSAGVAVLGLLAMTMAQAGAADRHAGYYYPEPSIETYLSRAQTLPDANRETRIEFVVTLTGELLSRPYPPQYSIFAKGDQGEKLIIVALNENSISTLFQARALLAQLTSVARTTPFFKQMAVEDYFTFLDLLKLLGFRQLTISDGESFAHQIQLQ